MKNEKVINFEDIKSKIQELKFDEKTEKKDFLELVALFFSIKEIKGVEDFQVEELFDYAINKLGSRYWRFLLEIFGKIFYDNKSNYSKILQKLIKSKVEKSLVDIVDNNQVNVIIAHLISDDGYFELKDYIETNISNKKLDKNKQIEVISLFYIFVLLKIKMQNSSLNKTIINNAQKAYIESFSAEDKEDLFSIKRNIRALLKNEHKSKFYDSSFLYEGLTEKNYDLNKEINKLNTMLINRNSQMVNLNEVLRQKESEIISLKNEVLEKLGIIESLQQDLSAMNNRNDFDKNRYEQQYKTLKKSFTDKLRSDIKLDIQGIEDIAEGLGENTCLKIQRRIDNIYKTLQRNGE